MKFGTYLYFNGDCREAIEYYCTLFKQPMPKIQTYGEIPPTDEHQLPEDAKNLVLYSELEVEGYTFYMSDNLPGYEAEAGENISVVIDATHEEELREMYHYLRKEGEVLMDMRETFFSELYARVRDRFGIQWELNYTGIIKDVSI